MFTCSLNELWISYSLNHLLNLVEYNVREQHFEVVALILLLEVPQHFFESTNLKQLILSTIQFLGNTSALAEIIAVLLLFIIIIANHLIFEPKHFKTFDLDMFLVFILCHPKKMDTFTWLNEMMNSWWFYYATGRHFCINFPDEWVSCWCACGCAHQHWLRVYFRKHEKWNYALEIIS